MTLQDMARRLSPRSIAGIREDSSFRTNLILCNTSEEGEVDVDLALTSADGNPLGTRRYRLPQLGMIQVSRVVRELGATGEVNGARLDLSTSTIYGRFAAYDP